MYLSEAISNITENIKNVIFMMSFLVIGFTGITLTDSMIYSTSLQAQNELNVNGNNILSIEFNKVHSGRKIQKIFNGMNYKLSMSRELFLNIGASPFSDSVSKVIGVDEYKLKGMTYESIDRFSGNVVVISDESMLRDNVFVNAVPFKVIGKIKNKRTDFLDSLGISTAKIKSSYVIPLKTVQRLALDDYISSVDLIKQNEITQEDIVIVKKLLLKNDIDDYTIHSVLDAKKTVENVFDRFSVLINSVYILLTGMVVIIVMVSCRKIFQSRSIEFALKVIHGIDKKTITRIVIIEVLLLILASSLLATIVTTILIHIISKVFAMDMHIRLFMISISFIIVMISCYTISVFSGKQFFNINPVSLIKKNSL